MAKCKAAPVDFYQEGDVPARTRQPGTICHVVHVLPSAGLSHNRLYIDCKPEDWPSRRRAIVANHPDWFAARRPTVYLDKRRPIR